MICRCEECLRNTLDKISPPCYRRSYLLNAYFRNIFNALPVYAVWYFGAISCIIKVHYFNPVDYYIQDTINMARKHVADDWTLPSGNCNSMVTWKLNANRLHQRKPDSGNLFARKHLLHVKTKPASHKPKAFFILSFSINIAAASQVSVSFCLATQYEAAYMVFKAK